MNEGLKKRIRELLRREYEQAEKRASQKGLLKKIKKELLAEGWQESYAGELIKLTRQAEKALGAELSKQKSGGKAELKAASQIIENVSGHYDYVYSKMVREVEKALSNAPSNRASWQDAAREALKPLLKFDHYVETELQTGQAALDRAIRINNLREGADEGETIYLRYEGPIPERDYCQRHFGKVYSLQEVEKMVNDMGQPALYYCGGYNCRHRWVQQRGELLASYKNGSKVIAGPGYQQQENETGIAKMRAKALKNRHVVLQKATGTQNKKSADVIENGVKYEYKTIRKDSIPSTATLNAIRRGKYQAAHIVLSSEQNIPKEDALNAIAWNVKNNSALLRKVEFWNDGNKKWEISLEGIKNYEI